jgi:hypothetical protein
MYPTLKLELVAAELALTAGFAAVLTAGEANTEPPGLGLLAALGLALGPTVELPPQAASVSRGRRTAGRRRRLMLIYRLQLR